MIENHAISANAVDSKSHDLESLFSILPLFGLYDWRYEPKTERVFWHQEELMEARKGGAYAVEQLSEFLQHFSPMGRIALAKHYKTAFRLGVAGPDRFTVRSKAGHARLIDSIAVARRDESGAAYFIGLFRDAGIPAEPARKGPTIVDIVNRFSNQPACGLIITGSDGFIKQHNSAVEKIFGIEDGTGINGRPISCLKAYGGIDIVEGARAAIDKRRFITSSDEALVVSLQTGPVTVEIHPWYDKNGDFAGIALRLEPVATKFSAFNADKNSRLENRPY